MSDRPIIGVDIVPDDAMYVDKMLGGIWPYAGRRADGAFLQETMYTVKFDGRLLVGGEPASYTVLLSSDQLVMLRDNLDRDVAAFIERAR